MEFQVSIDKNPSILDPIIFEIENEKPMIIFIRNTIGIRKLSLTVILSLSKRLLFSANSKPVDVKKNIIRACGI